MKNQMIATSMVAALLFVGCGSSSDGTELATVEQEKKVGIGYYVDAPIEGISFQCGTEVGLTDVNGTFTFEENATCTFSIGDLILREINASFLEENITILEDNITVAQLLQNLDADGNASNGILIEPGTGKVLRESNIIEIPEDEAVLASIRDDLRASNPDYNGTAVSREGVESHLNDTRERLETEGRRTQYDVNETREEGRNPNFENNETHGSENQPNFDANRTDNQLANFENNETHRDQNRTRPEGRPTSRG